MSVNRGTFEVPQGYVEMLQNFTITVLRTKPTDVVQLAIDYFTYHKQTGEDPASPTTMKHFCKAHKKGIPQPKTPHVKATSGKAVVHSYPAAPREDESDVEYETAPPPRNARRQSVAAERYNPEEDEDDDVYVIHPKTDSQRQRLNQVCKGILLFQNIDDEDMSHIVDAMFKVDVTPNMTVISQGEEGDNFYVIESGLYDVYIKDDKLGKKLVSHYENKGSFGEVALMYSCPRTATVISKTAGILWAMDRENFRKIVLKHAYKKRAMFESLLNNVPLLKELSPTERMSIADALISKTYQEGEYIIKQGQEGDEMFFIESGKIKLMRKDESSGTEKVLHILTSGSYFGELALVTKNPRAASALAASKCKVASLDRHSFERLLGPCLDIMKRNIQEYERQLKDIFG